MNKHRCHVLPWLLAQVMLPWLPGNALPYLLLAHRWISVPMLCKRSSTRCEAARVVVESKKQHTTTKVVKQHALYVPAITCVSSLRTD